MINIISIHDSADIYTIENILAFKVHSLVHASPIFTYGSASDPPTPSHDSPAESVTPKVHPNPRNNPPNPVPYVPADPGSDPSLSDSSLSDFLTHQITIIINEYDVQKITKRNIRVKHVSKTQSKGAQILHPGYLHTRKNQR